MTWNDTTHLEENHSVLNSKVIISLLLVLLGWSTSFAQAIKVEIAERDGGWTLLRDGKPYEVKGAGGQSHLDDLVEVGGNSIRTWSLEKAQEYLDEAHKRGLTVVMGLWVQHERHGFDYNDQAAVAKQLDYFTRKVREFKDHPALLMWGVGNEVDLFYTNHMVWNAVQDIAAMIHREDPNHPTTTITAGLHRQEVELVTKMAPDIDIFGVNTYSGLKHALDSIDDYGWDGPFLIAEWGPNGHWEVDKMPWGAPIEQSSSSKAQSYADRYRLILNAPNCVGSYVFLWGQKQETTSTWYGLFTYDGNQTEPIDELHKAWKKSDEQNHSPQIKDFGLFEQDQPVKQNFLIEGKSYQAFAKFHDPDGDKLRISWSIVSESTDTKAGGDVESTPPAIPGLIQKRGSDGITFKAPQNEGAYRLYINARDGKGKTGYVNIPFYVKPDLNPSNKVQLRKRELEFSY